MIDAVRSPRGRGKAGKGGLADVHPQRVLAQVLQELERRNGLDTADIDDVIMGCAAGSGDHAMDIARMAVLDAGWSLDAPGVTLNRFCGSGQQAVNFAAMGVLAGHQDLVVGGGVESMSRTSPMHVDGFTANNAHLAERFPMVPQGISADLIASLRNFQREDCDALALESQRRAGIAIEEGRFEKSIVPIYHDDGRLALDHDEHPRPSTTLDDLNALRPSFEAMGAAPSSEGGPTFDELALQSYPEVSAIRHVHHAGNSSGVVDGAAVAGTEPVIMLTAPAPATERVLAKAKMTLDDIDLFEVNEAFASVVLDWFRATEVDRDKVNVNGGAMALGHPIGATGSMLIGTLLDELERRDLSTGLVTMCTGGGMGTATIIERL